MRAIKDLITKEHPRVWFYIGEDVATKKSFLSEVNEYLSPDTPYTLDFISTVMGISTSGQLCHVSLFIWCRSFSPDVIFLGPDPIPLKIHYKRYHTGQEDYIMKTPEITPLA